MSRLKGITGFSAALLLAAPVLMSVPVAGWAQIDEIVVTTRKREESLQDVPLAISALTAEQIQRQGIRDLDDVVKLTPSVQFDNSFGPADTRITVRGLSNTRGRSNVAFLVDGVDVTTENLVTAGSGLLANRRLLNDVERIEIVKGPQSALYGRAAFAGAISYISKEPGTEVEARLSADIAEDDQYVVDFSYGGPVKGM
jgi:outer membrane receptor protein involved in Fe transport